MSGKRYKDTKIQRDKYRKYNQLDEIQEAMVVYIDNRAAGGGAIRRYDDENMELKRVILSKNYNITITPLYFVRSGGIDIHTRRHIEQGCKIYTNT